MAKKTSKKSKKAPAKRHCPPCTPATMARHAYGAAKRAGRCDIQSKALDTLKEEVGKQADNMTPPARRLAFSELLRKQQEVQHCEASESSRFNGLLGLGIFGIL